MKHLQKFKDFSLYEKSNNIYNYFSKIEKIENDFPNEVKAMLDVIAFAEGTIKYPDNGYKTIYSGVQFDSYKDHPRKAITAGNYTSTAAGRYQFLAKSWDWLMRGESFSPENQDIGATKYLKRKGAIRQLEKGNFEKAIYKVRNIWASLPWSKYGQPAWYASSDNEKFKVLEDLYQDRLEIYNGDKNESSYDSIKDLKIPFFGKKNQKRKGFFTKKDTFPFEKNKTKGDKVVDLQKAITEMGGDLNRYGVDGKFGNETLLASKLILDEIGIGINKNNELSENEYNSILKATKDRKLVKNVEKDLKKINL